VKTDADRIEIARWVLERNLAWIAAADAKVGVVVAMDTAMLAGLGAALSTAPAKSALLILVAVAAALALARGLYCAAMAVLPRIDGPQDSLLFFQPISKMPLNKYQEQFIGATDVALLQDCLSQIHRNAEIAATKHAWVRSAMGWSFVSAVPWLLVIGLRTFS
jgi:hypothetical protein